MSQGKTCYNCNETKPITDFSPYRNGYRGKCRPCSAEYENKRRNETMETIHCQKCGVEEQQKLATLDKRASRNGNLKLCKDCNIQGPIKQIRYGKDYCTPWHGDFDGNDNPMKNGRLYKPGKRTCGHRDCVNVRHIVAPAIPDGFKQCTNCLKVQLLFEFGIDRKKSDGLNNECKTCKRTRDRERDAKNLEAERFSRAYLDGRQLTYDELLAELKKERFVA